MRDQSRVGRNPGLRVESAQERFRLSIRATSLRRNDGGGVDDIQNRSSNQPRPKNLSLIPCARSACQIVAMLIGITGFPNLLGTYSG
jgi:hypothetical protein